MDEKPLYWFNLETGYTMLATCYERYLGLRGQERVGLVDRNGRVHHYDADEVTPMWIPGFNAPVDMADG